MRVAVRTDASSEIGTGHVARCLALACKLRERGAEVVFVCRSASGDLCDFIAGQGFRVQRLAAAKKFDRNQDAAQTSVAIQALAPVDWLIVDHYAIDAHWEAALRPRVTKLVVIDDLADRHHDCDVLVDQSYRPDDADRYRGRVPGHCQLLLGPRFALLQASFSQVRPGAPRRAEALNRIVVFLSGTDPRNVTRRVLDAIDAFASPSLHVDVIVGVASTHVQSLKDYCATRANRKLHVQTTEMAALLASADLAIGGGGVSTWERACIGVPSLVIGLAKNQFASAELMAGVGAQLYLGDVEKMTEAQLQGALAVLYENRYLRDSLARASFKLVDGRGVDRLVKLLVRSEVQVRRAEERDCDLIYSWRSHENSLRHFFDATPPSASEHRRWYFETLANTARALLIGVADGKDIGVLRYDFAATEARISIYLDPMRQGEGLGPALLAAGTKWLLANNLPVRELVAEVLVENESSVRAFQAAGFSESYRGLRLKLSDRR